MTTATGIVGMVSGLPSALHTQVLFYSGCLKEEKKEEQTLKEQTLLPRVKPPEQQLTGELRPGSGM